MARGQPPSASIPTTTVVTSGRAPHPAGPPPPVIPGCGPLFSSLSRKSKYVSWSHFPSSAPHPALPAFRPAPRTGQETLELPPICQPYVKPHTPPTHLHEYSHQSPSHRHKPHTHCPLPDRQTDSGHRMAPPEMPEHAACMMASASLEGHGTRPCMILAWPLWQPSSKV